MVAYSDLVELEEWSSEKDRSIGAVGGMFRGGRGGTAGGGILPLSFEFREELPVKDLQ